MRQLIIDTETTGLDPKAGHRIIEFAALELVDRRPTGRSLHFHFNPERDIDFVEIPLAHNIRLKALGAIAGSQTVPQVFINGERIGGYEELKRWAARAA